MSSSRREFSASSAFSRRSMLPQTPTQLLFGNGDEHIINLRPAAEKSCHSLTQFSMSAIAWLQQLMCVPDMDDIEPKILSRHSERSFTDLEDRPGPLRRPQHRLAEQVHTVFVWERGAAT